MLKNSRQTLKTAHSHRDISLREISYPLESIPLLGSRTAEALRLLGITDIKGFVSLTEREILKVADELKRVSEKLALDRHIHQRLLMAYRYAKAIVLRRPLIYGKCNTLDLLEKLIKERKVMLLDLEYDPSISFIFIIGIMNTEGRTTQFFIETLEEEKEALITIKDVLARNMLVTYAGKSADIPTIRKSYSKHGLYPPKLSLIDLFYDVIFTQKPERQAIYLPLTDLSEKTVASYLGYSYPKELKIRDGLQALLVFHRYKHERNPRLRNQIREQLLLYNRCDLEMIKIVLQKLLDIYKIGEKYES